MTHGRHVPALDGLRAVAVALVVLRHVTPAAAVLPWGWAGVDLFFVLSGFLITGVLRDARGDGARAAPGYYPTFYARRVLRIVPLYAVTLAAMAALDPGVAARLWPLATYTVNWSVARHGWGAVPEPASHFWSLAVEEQFYLAWPVLVSRCPPRYFRAACLALVGAALAVRVGLLAAGQPVAAFVFTLARVDGFAVGALVALAPRWPGWRRVALPALGVAALALWRDGGAPEGWAVQTVGYTALALASGGAVAWAVGTAPRWLAAAPLREVGRRSYGVYVLHLPVVRLCYGLGVREPWALAAVAGGLTLLLAWASWRVIEAPALALKRRLVPLGVRHGVAATAAK